MLSVLADPILPVFAIGLLGYVSGRASWFGTDEARILNRFAMTVLLPVFLFRATALAPWPEFQVLPLILYLLVEASVYAAGYVIARRLFRRPRQEALLIGFAGVFANNAYYTLPIAQFLYDEAGVLPITSVIMLDSVLAFAGTMITLEVMTGRDAGASAGRVAGKVLRLPLVWALTAGILLSATGLPFPASLDTFAGFVGRAASPTALFAMGVILSVTPLMPDGPTWIASGIKVVLFPLALWAALVLAAPGVTPDGFVLAGAGPTGAMAFSMALLYGVRTETVMRITIWTTLATLATMAWLA
ncbi:MAG: AEC family transporter [Pseudooceanicola sp.]